MFSLAKASHRAKPDLNKLGICNPSIGTDMKCLNNTIDHCCIKQSQIPEANMEATPLIK